jgi:serine O-acetyltransferase
MLAACGCESGTLRQTIKIDVDRYVFEAERHGIVGPTTLVRIAILNSSMWAVLGYRLAHHALTRVKPRILGHALGILLQIGQRIIVAVTGVDIDARAHIGPGLLVPHGGSIVIGPVRIGRDCNIFQSTTLGISTTEEDTSQWATPVLEDRVWVGPGAVIAGGIRVGHDASISANSLLVRDVPSRAVMVGVPARLVSRKGSFAQIAYRGMNDDPERLAARGGDDVSTDPVAPISPAFPAGSAFPTHPASPAADVDPAPGAPRSPGSEKNTA